MMSYKEDWFCKDMCRLLAFGESRSWEWVGVWNSRWLRGRGIGGSWEGSFGCGSIGEFSHIRVEDAFWFLATWVGRILCEVAFTWQLTISWASAIKIWLYEVIFQPKLKKHILGAYIQYILILLQSTKFVKMV